MSILPKKLYTLCFLIKDNQILLGYKKRGLGEGKWLIGFGGKVHDGEDIETAVKREVLEETGLVASMIEPHAVYTFHHSHDPRPQEVHCYAIKEYQGQPTESEEIRPAWFSLEAIPWNQMWEGTKHILPLILAGKTFTGDFWYEGEGYGKEKLVQWELKELKSKNEK